jgi:Cdc6-like AAA superfamily ATPase
MKSREPGDWEILWHEAGQVFSPGAPIDEQELFAGRADQVRELISAVYQRGQHAIVFGERGVGKTSLANTFTKFMHAPLSRVIATRVNCDGIDDFSNIWHKAVEDWDISPLLPERVTPDDVRRALREIAANNIAIIVLDEFDRLRDPSATRLIADTIKTLSDHSVAATVIIVGVADSVSDLIKEHASIGRALIEIPMPRMRHDELREIIEKRLARLGMHIEPKSERAIVIYSQGLPHYTHLLGLFSAQAAIERRSKTITNRDIETSIQRCLNKAQQSIREAYDRATASPRRDNLFKQVLLACALAEKDDLGYFTASSVAQPMSNIMERRYEIPNFAQHLKDFCDKKRGPILEQRGSTRRFRYRFCDPLMQPYITLLGLRDGTVTWNV